MSLHVSQFHYGLRYTRAELFDYVLCFGIFTNLGISKHNLALYDSVWLKCWGGAAHTIIYITD